ncbi:MAG: MlaD family protein [Acidobacteriaceae bacterium]
MPSQQEIRWSKLRVGLTVVIAAVTLAILVILMGSSTGILTKKIHLTTYFTNAEGVRDGAAVRLQGVDIGNVTRVGVVPGAALPVKVEMKVTTKYFGAVKSDSVAALETAGVLGETFVDIDSTNKHGPNAQDYATLPSVDKPGIQDVVKSSQTTLDNINVLLKRLDTIVGTIEDGKGSIGKIINDPSLFNNANAALNKLQLIADEIQTGKGSIGKLLTSEDLYNKVNGSLDRLNKMLDDVEAGQGTLGKLTKDPALYNDADQMLVESRNLIVAIRQNPKKYLSIKLHIF